MERHFDCLILKNYNFIQVFREQLKWQKTDYFQTMIKIQKEVI